MPVRDESANRIYYEQRAREEWQRAVVCEDNSAALAHLRMAEEYDRRALTIELARTSVSNA